MSVSLPIVHLIIPKLFEPLALWHKDFMFSPEAPFLLKLLSQYEIYQKTTIDNYDACLFANIGFEESELPFALYRIQSQAKIVKTGGGVYSINFEDFKNKTLLCADPVHLEVGLNDITLTKKVIDLSDKDAQEVINALNEYFNQDGFTFYLGSAGQWYLSVERDESLATTPVDHVVRKHIAKYLPVSDKLNWKSLQNEVQMLLHSLPINTEREMQGLTTINSLWFWGGGQAQAQINSINHIFSTSETRGKVLACAAETKCTILSKDINIHSLIESLEGENIFILDQLYEAAIHDDIHQFQEELASLDSDFIRPLADAWHAGLIHLSLEGCDGRKVRPVMIASWKFWAKKPKLLNNIASNVIS